MAMTKKMKRKKKKVSNLTVESILTFPKEKRIELYKKIDSINMKIDNKTATEKELELFLFLNLAWIKDDEVQDYNK